MHLIWDNYYIKGQLGLGKRARDSFWWRDVLKSLHLFSLGWQNPSQRMENRFVRTYTRLAYPEFVLFHKKKVSLHITKAKFAHYHLHSPFYLPFSAEAFEHFRISQVKLVVLLYQKIMIHALCKKKDHDTWTYIWGNGTYSSGKAYKHLKGSQGYSSNF